MPRGLMNSQARDPRNFTLAEWQQAKRIGKDPRAIKTALQDCWAVSDSRRAFTAALEEGGYKLARGDRRGFVALDMQGEIYAIAKWVGVKTKDVRARLGDESSLPSVSERKAEIANQIATRLHTIRSEQDRLQAQRLNQAAQERKTLIERQRQARKQLIERQRIRWEKEVLERQQGFNRGLRGWFDRFSGQHKRIKLKNEEETRQASIRDRAEKDALIFRQLEERRSQRKAITLTHLHHKAQKQHLTRDIERQQLVLETVKYGWPTKETSDSGKRRRRKRLRADVLA